MDNWVIVENMLKTYRCRKYIKKVFMVGKSAIFRRIKRKSARDFTDSPFQGPRQNCEYLAL